MRRAKRWFGDFLKPEKPESKGKGDNQEEMVNGSGGRGTNMFLGWLLFLIVLVLLIVFVFLWVMRGRDVEAAEGRVNALADVAGALLEGDYAGLRESLGRSQAFGMPKNVENVLSKIGIASTDQTTFARKLLAAAKQNFRKEDLQKALFKEIEEATQQRIARAAPRALKRMLGEDKTEEFFKFLVKEAEAVDLKEMLGERLDMLIRQRLEELKDERAATVIGPRLTRLFALLVRRVATNYPALVELLTEDAVMRLAATLFANIPDEQLAPLLEERIEKLQEAVKEWRRKNRVTVFLKDGKTVEGVLLKKTKSELVIRKDDGKKEVLPLDKVKEIKKTND